MNTPTNLKYTKNDEWVKVEGNIGTIGITDHAQEQLSDIVYVEIVLSVGDSAKQSGACATLESVKAAAEVYLPVGGRVIEVNETLPDSPEKVNTDPYGDAWMVKLELTDQSELDGLLDAAAYEAQVQEKE